MNTMNTKTLARPPLFLLLVILCLGQWTMLGCASKAEPPATAKPAPDQSSARSARMMVLVGFPDPFPSDEKQRSALLVVDEHGAYKDGLVLGTVSPEAIAGLRAAGAEVFVIDDNSNVYLANTAGMSADERVAYIDERWKAPRDAGKR